TLRVLSEADVKSLVTMREVIEVQKEAFALVADGSSVPGFHRWLDRHAADPACLVGFLPSFLTRGRGFGVKIVSDFYGQRGHDLPRMMAIVVVCDGQTGAPRAVMEGGHLADSPRQCVPVSDIVIAATTADAPLFDGHDLRAGTFVLAGGAYREVDSATLRRAGKVVVDTRENIHVTVFEEPLRLGIVTEDAIAELGELVLGRKPGRETPDEITFCKTQGVPA